MPPASASSLEVSRITMWLYNSISISLACSLVNVRLTVSIVSPV